MKKENYKKAFATIVKRLTTQAETSRTIPGPKYCQWVIESVKAKYKVEAGLFLRRIVLFSEISGTELFINRRVWGKKDQKIEIHFFYRGILMSSYELNFHPDGSFYKYSTSQNAAEYLANTFNFSLNKN